MKKNKTGFTLVELIVVVGIMGVLGLIFTNTLVQSLRGQSKVKVINQIKQNGQAVLERLSGEMRRAEKVVCVGKINDPSIKDSGDSLTIFNKGVYSRFRFFAPGACPNSSNGCLRQLDFTAADIPDSVSEGNLCSDNQDYNPGSVTATLVNLTDIDPVNGVSVQSDGQKPLFRRDSSAGFSDSVEVQFRAFPGVLAGQTSESAVPEGILFATTVQLRGGK